MAYNAASDRTWPGGAPVNKASLCTAFTEPVDFVRDLKAGSFLGDILLPTNEGTWVKLVGAVVEGVEVENDEAHIFVRGSSVSPTPIAEINTPLDIKKATAFMSGPIAQRAAAMREHSGSSAPKSRHHASVFGCCRKTWWTT